MRISYTKYENAPLATACSFLGNVVGGLMAGSGLVAVFSKEFCMGLALIAVGIGLVAGATVLSEKWWKAQPSEDGGSRL